MRRTQVRNARSNARRVASKVRLLTRFNASCQRGNRSACNRYAKYSKRYPVAASKVRRTQIRKARSNARRVASKVRLLTRFNASCQRGNRSACNRYAKYSKRYPVAASKVRRTQVRKARSNARRVASKVRMLTRFNASCQRGNKRSCNRFARFSKRYPVAASKVRASNRTQRVDPRVAQQKAAQARAKAEAEARAKAAAKAQAEAKARVAAKAQAEAKAQAGSQARPAAKWQPPVDLAESQGTCNLAGGWKCTAAEREQGMKQWREQLKQSSAKRKAEYAAEKAQAESQARVAAAQAKLRYREDLKAALKARAAAIKRAYAHLESVHLRVGGGAVRAQDCPPGVYNSKCKKKKSHEMTNQRTLENKRAGEAASKRRAAIKSHQAERAAAVRAQWCRTNKKLWMKNNAEDYKDKCGQLRAMPGYAEWMSR